MGPLDLVFVAAAVLWGLIPGALAASRGRNFIGWWLLGAAGGFVALMFFGAGFLVSNANGRTIASVVSLFAGLAPLLLAGTVPRKGVR